MKRYNYKVKYVQKENVVAELRKQEISASAVQLLSDRQELALNFCFLISLKFEKEVTISWLVCLRFRM